MEGLLQLNDLNEHSFPFKDMSRRKNQTLLAILGLAICVSITVFMLLFGENIGLEVTSIIHGGMTLGFTAISSRFIMLVFIFNSATGILISYFLISAIISERVRDIGIMKAVAVLPKWFMATLPQNYS